MRRIRSGALAAAGLIVVCADSYAALPPGRAWTGIDTLKVNDHPYMVPDRFEPPRDGRIELIAAGYHGPTLPAGASHRTYGFVWADSVWRIRWSMEDQAYAIWPTITPRERQMLVWKSTDIVDPSPPELSYLITADIEGDSVSPRDTVVRLRAEALAYTGTSWGERRWVAVRDVDPARGYVLRLFVSDARKVWQETAPTGLSGLHGMQIAALDTATVLVITAEGNSGIRWGYLKGTVFEEANPPLSVDALTLRPGLRPRPDGGFWCAWNANIGVPDWSDIIEVRGYKDGVWSAPETLRTRKPFDAQHIFYQAELGAEGSEIPAFAWYGYATSGDVAYYIWTSFPTDDGPGLGERFEGSWSGINPTLVRDENGDMWLAWWRTFDGVYWAHTHATAIPSAPALAEQNQRPILRWSLDRLAPESWWAVMRAEGDGPLERVARLRANRDTVMSWADTSAPTSLPLRYAIRRECRDTRYQVTGPEARWEPRGPVLSLALRGPNPADDRVEFEVIGASAGTLDVRLFDLQGREVARRRPQAAGAGRDNAILPLPGELSPGLYLLRVAAADGRRAPTLKLAIVR